MFASDRSGAMAVYAVASPGASPQRLSPDDGALWFPGPAGASHGVMLRAVDGPGDHHAEQLYLQSPKGEPVPVGAAARAVRNPSWSEAGTVLVYESSVAGFRDIWSVRPGAVPIQRTAAEAGCFEPAVLPGDASMVMVCSGRDPDLRVVSLDGAEPEPEPRWLMERRGEDLRPTPGGPGGRLAFYAQLDRTLTVWTVQPDGLGAGPAFQPDPQLALVADQPPVWSPDGTTLAVVLRARSGAPQVWLLEFRGDGPPEAEGRPVPGVPASHSSESPTWLPDGTLLVTVDKGRNADIWRVDPGTGATEVWVEAPGTDWLPRWWSSGAFPSD